MRPNGSPRIVWLAAPIAFLAIFGCGGSTNKSEVGIHPIIRDPVHVEVDQTVDFKAFFQNSTDQGVTWKVKSGGASGAITQTGVYTAPATISMGRDKDTIIMDPSNPLLPDQSMDVFVDVRVTINETSPRITVNTPLVPDLSKYRFSFTAAVLGDGDPNPAFRGVTWSIEPEPNSAGGSIDANTGVYTAPSKPGSDKIVATSNVQPNKAVSTRIQVESAGTVPVEIR